MRSSDTRREPCTKQPGRMCKDTGDPDIHRDEMKEGTTMPRGDRTGPMGLGPMTGRGAGYCAGSGVPGFMNPAGRGGFRGRGGGRGWRHWFHATGLPGWARAEWGLPVWGAGAYPAASEMADEAQLAALKTHAAHLEQTLQSLRQRIQKLEDQAKSE
ncbi:MAG: DUF5320 domain-containing protein [Opitutales bacterium]